MTQDNKFKFPEAQYSRCIAKSHILHTSHAFQELHHLQYIYTWFSREAKQIRKVWTWQVFTHTVKLLGCIWMRLWTEGEENFKYANSQWAPIDGSVWVIWCQSIVLVLGGRRGTWCFCTCQSTWQCAHCGLGAVYGCAWISLTRKDHYQVVKLLNREGSHIHI